MPHRKLVLARPQLQNRSRTRPGYRNPAKKIASVGADIGSGGKRGGWLRWGRGIVGGGAIGYKRRREQLFVEPERVLLNFAGKDEVEKAPADRLRHPDGLRIGQRDDAELSARKQIDAGRGAEVEPAGMAPVNAALVIVVDIPAEPIAPGMVDHRILGSRA